jgi:hypothetical protein
MVPKPITKFIAADGTLFETMYDAEQYERGGEMFRNWFLKNYGLGDPPVEEALLKAILGAWNVTWREPPVELSAIEQTVAAVEVYNVPE